MPAFRSQSTAAGERRRPEPVGEKGGGEILIAHPEHGPPGTGRDGTGRG